MAQDTGFALYLLVLVLYFVVGIIGHEVVHWITGWMGGGNPYFSKFRLRIIPRQVDYETPEQMSKNWARAAGGSVFLFPIGLFVHLLSVSLFSMKIHIPLLLFLLGGSGISWFDLFALYEPELWKKWTAGGDINREMIDE